MAKRYRNSNQTGEIVYTNDHVLKAGIEFTLNYIKSQDAKQRLFNLMYEEHNLTLLEGEMNDIVCALTNGLTDEYIPLKQGILFNDKLVEKPIHIDIFDSKKFEENTNYFTIKGGVLRNFSLNQMTMSKPKSLNNKSVSQKKKF